jgi:hypothetical protein
LRGQAELGERSDKVDYQTVWNFVPAEGLSFKKACCQASKSVLTSRATGRGEDGRLDVTILRGSLGSFSNSKGAARQGR